MTGYMYILKCCDDSYYTGSTKNLEYRLWQHQNGEGANFTKKRLPVELVYFEEYSRIDEAFYREKQVQGWTRRKKEALIEGRPHDLPQLAKKVWSNRNLRSLSGQPAFDKPPEADFNAEIDRNEAATQAPAGLIEATGQERE